MKTEFRSSKARHWFALLVATALVALARQAHAQGGVPFSDANWISMNQSIPGADWSVNAAVVDDSGNLYIGGDFAVVGDVIGNCIAKWDGTNWSALGSGIGGVDSPGVSALAVFGNNVYVAGYFTTAGGIVASNIAKWDGTNWSALGSGMNGWVGALAVSGNDVYAG